MPDGNELKAHIVFSGRNTSGRYTSPKSGGSSIAIQQRNPSVHGQSLRAKLTALKQHHEQVQNDLAPEGILQEDITYVDFISDVNFELAFESFEDTRGKYHLLSSQKEGNQFRPLLQ